MGSIALISGTDTGIGKTWVGCRLAEAARATGVVVRSVKLVETGTPEEPAAGEDGVLLAEAAAQPAPRAALRRYRTAVAAAAAADLEQIPFDLEIAVDETRAIAQHAEITLVEGAGGLLAPLTWTASMIDVARWLDAPIVIVTADRLGTINHTLLTLQALQRAGIPCPVIVMNTMKASGDDASAGSNAAALRRLWPATPLIETCSPAWTTEVIALLR